MRGDRASGRSWSPPVPLKVLDAVEAAALLAEALGLALPHQGRQLEVHLADAAALEVLPALSQGGSAPHHLNTRLQQIRTILQMGSQKPEQRGLM